MWSEGFGDASRNQKVLLKASSSLSILPSTVSQLLSATRDHRDTFSLYDLELNQVSIVGVVRGFAPFVTFVQYSVDDMTGPPLVVKQWVNPEEPLQTFQCEGVHVKVIGNLHNFNGQRSVLAMDVRRVSDPNEITSHMMQVVEAHMRLSGQMLDVNMNAAGGKRVGPPAHGLSAVQQQVLEAIRRFSLNSPDGASFNSLRTNLDNVPVPDLRKCLDFLLNEGHIFCFIDENHFKAAEY